MTEDGTGPVGNGGESWNEQAGPKQASRNLLRLLKPVIIIPEQGKYVDPNAVSSRFYNCFHYSLLSKDRTGVNLTVGITSANPGEGKTLVASNLAVSLAVANQRDTVLVDMNMRSPRIHRIFGTELSPGLVEALSDTTIRISKTQIEHLCVLPAGNLGGSLVVDYIPPDGEGAPSAADSASVGLEHVAAFRDVLYSLRQEFEFVIVDMPAMQEPFTPLLLVHQMDGILVVVDAKRTRHEDIQRIFQHVNEKQILGFVFNRASESIIL